MYLRNARAYMYFILSGLHKCVCTNTFKQQDKENKTFGIPLPNPYWSTSLAVLPFWRLLIAIKKKMQRKIVRNTNWAATSQQSSLLWNYVWGIKLTIEFYLLYSIQFDSFLTGTIWEKRIEGTTASANTFKLCQNKVSYRFWRKVRK